jgi:hypothetical protein
MLCEAELARAEVTYSEDTHNCAWRYKHVVEIDTQCKTLDAGEGEQLKLEREVGGRGHHGE